MFSTIFPGVAGCDVHRIYAKIHIFGWFHTAPRMIHTKTSLRNSFLQQFATVDMLNVCFQHVFIQAAKFWPP